MTLAYTVAALVRWPPKKRFPKLDKLMAKPTKREPVNWQDQFAAAELWVAASGGKVVQANGKDN